jgi:hypothetical protein
MLVLVLLCKLLPPRLLCSKHTGMLVHASVTHLLLRCAVPLVSRRDQGQGEALPLACQG